MFFSFSFPLGEASSITDFKKRIKSINRFFQKKTNPFCTSCTFTVQLLEPSSVDLPKESKDYYICFKYQVSCKFARNFFFKFFNKFKKSQPKLQILYGIGDSENIYKKLQLDVCLLSRISGIELQKVEFSYDVSNLNIAIEFSEKYVATIKAHLDMLIKNFGY